MTDPTEQPGTAGGEQPANPGPTRTHESLEALEPVEDRTDDLPPLRPQD